MTEPDEEARTVFVEHAAGELIAQGFPAMPARILMALTASDDGRLTSDDLQDQLDVSAAAISQAVRYLQTVGFVHRTTSPGSRRHVYRIPAQSAWYTATLARAGGMQRIVSVLREGVDAIPAGSPARARLDEMIGFFEFLERRMPELLDEWEVLRKERGTPNS